MDRFRREMLISHRMHGVRLSGSLGDAVLHVGKSKRRGGIPLGVELIRGWSVLGDDDATEPARTRRLTREDWIAFARKTLVQSGIENVKVDRLAKRAKVTRGSFYHHFRDRKDLLAALLRDWEVRNHIEVAEIRDRWARSEPDLTEIILIWLGEDRGYLDFDMAIRSWARQAREVADVVHRVDAAWIGLLEQLFADSGYQGDDCVVRARITYFHQVGYHALDFPESAEQRLKLVPVYYEALTGKPATPKLTARLNELASSLKIRPGTRRGRRKDS